MSAEQQAWLKYMTKVVFPSVGAKTLHQACRAHEQFCKANKIVPDELPEGTMVMLKTQDCNKKFDPCYEGPFMVVRHNRGGAYILCDATGTILPCRVPIDHLCPISHKGIISEESFVVECILDHCDTKAGQEYLVKWEGFPDSATLWEPLHHFDMCKCISDYHHAIAADSMHSEQVKGSKKRKRRHH